MTPEQIAAWATEADLARDYYGDGTLECRWRKGTDMAGYITRFAALVAAHERERCAVAANEFLTQGRSPLGRSVAAAIRAQEEAPKA